MNFSRFVARASPRASRKARKRSNSGLFRAFATPLGGFGGAHSRIWKYSQALRRQRRSKVAVPSTNYLRRPRPAVNEQSFAKTPHPAYSLDSREPLSWQVSRDDRSPSQSKLEDWIGVNQDRMVERSVSPRPSRGFRSVGAVRLATPLPVVWSRSAPAQSAISPSSAPPGAYRRFPTRVPRRSGLEAP